MIIPPEWLLRLPIYSGSGHLTQTDYGWRFFPGSKGTRKAVKALRECGYAVIKMKCGTYKVTENG